MVSASACHVEGRGFESPLSRKNGFDLGPARTRAESLTHASLFGEVLFSRWQTGAYKLKIK
jgi:hypothetical protein